MITYDDFAKLDIRVGTIISAEKMEGADKLLILKVDAGEENPRQIIAGIAESFNPEELVNKQIPIIANLEPRMLRGHESHGMILAMGAEEGLVLLHPGREAKPGSKIK